MIINYSLDKELFLIEKKIPYRLIDEQNARHIFVAVDIPGREGWVATYQLNKEGEFTGFNFFDKETGKANLYKNNNYNLYIELGGEQAALLINEALSEIKKLEKENEILVDKIKLLENE